MKGAAAKRKKSVSLTIKKIRGEKIKLRHERFRGTVGGKEMGGKIG